MRKVLFSIGGANQIAIRMNGSEVTGPNVFERCDWLDFSGTVERKYMKLGVKMTAMFNNGEAKPIRFAVGEAVWQIFAETLFSSLSFRVFCP